MGVEMTKEEKAAQTKKYNKKYYAANKEAVAAQKKIYNRDNAETIRWKKIMRIYGINEQDYDNIFAEQEGRCAICSTHQSDLNLPLNVDHDHGTGLVRGLLCGKCNIGIGQLNDDACLLRKAADYLER
jgi:hypothetical protein